MWAVLTCANVLGHVHVSGPRLTQRVSLPCLTYMDFSYTYGTYKLKKFIVNFEQITYIISFLSYRCIKFQINYSLPIIKRKSSWQIYRSTFIKIFIFFTASLFLGILTRNLRHCYSSIERICVIVFKKISLYIWCVLKSHVHMMCSLSGQPTEMD
jgi:hypothetical protein